MNICFQNSYQRAFGTFPLKGDVLAAQGKKGEARAAYTAAQGKLEGKGGVAAELLQQKLDALGEGA